MYIIFDSGYENILYWICETKMKTKIGYNTFQFHLCWQIFSYPLFDVFGFGVEFCEKK